MTINKLKIIIKGLIELAETELENFDDRVSFIKGELHAYNKILKLLDYENKCTNN